MATGFHQVLDYLQRTGQGPSDGQLLARFVAAREEASFAALVRRHGPMVLGVCRRVLRDCHDAEDAFQATFLVLARKAASVVRRESLGCWLYQVAYHTALEAAAARARRRGKERQVKEMPHPEVAATEAQDWRPLLDREVSRLPEKYRAAVVLCDLEGHSRREAARLLGVPEGTLSSRLATARKTLARRLAGAGIMLAGGVLAAGATPGAAAAGVPAALVASTARAATLIVAGQLAAGSTPALVLMRGVLKAMLMKKLRLAVGALLAFAAFGAVGVSYRAGNPAGAARAAGPDRPASELEALRKENELLKLNLQVVLEKVRAQEAELQTLRDGERGHSRAGGGLMTSGAMGGMPGTGSGPSAGMGGPGMMSGPTTGGAMGGMPGAGGVPPPGAGRPGMMPGGTSPGVTTVPYQGVPSGAGLPGGSSASRPGGAPGDSALPSLPLTGRPPGYSDLPAGSSASSGTGAIGDRPPLPGQAREFVEEADAALEQLRQAGGDKAKQRHALDALEHALRKLKEQPH